MTAALSRLVANMMRSTRLGSHAPRAGRLWANGKHLGQACRPPSVLLYSVGRRNLATALAAAPDAGPVAAAADEGKLGRRRPVQNTAVSTLLLQLQSRLPPYCCGCGVKLQQEDPDAPGYFQIPKRLLELGQQQAAAAPEAITIDDSGVDDEEKQRRAVDRMMEAWLDEQQRPADKGAVTAPKSDDIEAGGIPDVSCARCYSLTHYGKVKSESAEGVLPEFDLAKKVGRKIALQKDRRAVVLCVVDVWDFDGSLPRLALRSLFPATMDTPEAGLPASEPPFKLMVAANKFDLLPSQATARRVETWVRTRLRQAGLPRPEKVFMVSAMNGFGVREMLTELKEQMGFRADLWVVGAQNAGKSSLINAMKRIGGTSGKREPTVAPVPGTTLGLLRVPGIPLGPKHRTFDTPGVPHPYQLTSMLPVEEVGLVLPRKRLRPRTYRIGAGNTILLGGLLRLDVVSIPGSSVYVTAYMSDEFSSHMGKTEGAEERRTKHVGGLLVPPCSPERLEEMGELVSREVGVEGDSWTHHSKDIAVAGLGWLGVGCVGRADFRLWTLPGVAVTVHDALVPDYAKDFQKPGFSRMLPTTAPKPPKRAPGAGKRR